MYINRIENTTLEYSRNMFGKWPNSKQSKVIMYFLCVITNQAFFGASSTVKQSEFSRWIALIRPLIVESYSHYEEISCNNSFRSKIWLYCQKSKITLQKGPKSLTFYSEFFGGYIFWDKWNVEADCESLLKNLKSLPSYSILMPDHSIKLFFTGSKVIQILEYLRAYTFTFKNTAYSQLNKEKMACLTQNFWNA